MFYQCLTGQLPFPTDTLEQVLGAHLSQPSPQPSAQHGGIPEDIDRVIANRHGQGPDQRYATARRLATEARAALGLARATSPSDSGQMFLSDWLIAKITIAQAEATDTARPPRFLRRSSTVWPAHTRTFPYCRKTFR
jgi:hypothetical protein